MAQNSQTFLAEQLFLDVFQFAGAVFDYPDAYDKYIVNANSLN